MDDRTEDDRTGGGAPRGATASSPRQRPRDRGHDRRHVLMVDSSRTFQDIVTQLLEDERYGVTTTGFVPEIFPMVVGLDPDLIIVDLAITAKAGWELLESLEREALTREIPVIVTSTDRRLLERAQANRERYGLEHYLVKPFDLDMLMDAIESLIGAP